MEPITRNEQHLAKAAGEYDGALPEPRTREEHWLDKIVERIENGQITPEEIDAAIEAYLNSHDADIVTEAELSDALAGKVDKETGKGLTDINYSVYEARHTHGNKVVLDDISAKTFRPGTRCRSTSTHSWAAMPKAHIEATYIFL